MTRTRRSSTSRTNSRGSIRDAESSVLEGAQSTSGSLLTTMRCKFR
ncbi:hypothetical protein [Amycolatopsis sp. NPDC004625]